MKDLISGLGAKADMQGSAKERCGGLYTFVVSQTETVVVGLVRFPLQRIVNKARRSRVTGGNRPKIMWYCPFTARSIGPKGQLDMLSIRHEDLYFLGARNSLELCYRSSLPEELLFERFHSGRLRTSGGIRNDYIYRIPKHHFTGTFFSGKGKHLGRSLDVFVEANARALEGDSKFKKVEIRRTADLFAEMRYAHGNDHVSHIDQIFQAKLYGIIK